MLPAPPAGRQKVHSSRVCPYFAFVINHLHYPQFVEQSAVGDSLCVVPCELPIPSAGGTLTFNRCKAHLDSNSVSLLHDSLRYSWPGGHLKSPQVLAVRDESVVANPISGRGGLHVETTADMQREGH